MVRAIDDGLEIGRRFPAQMAQRVEAPRRPQRPAVPGIAQVHRLILHRDLQELPQRLQRPLIVFSFCRDGEHHVVVAETLGIAKAVKCVGHTLTRPFSASSPALDTRPIPVLVLARSSLYPRLSRMGATT